MSLSKGSLDYQQVYFENRLLQVWYLTFIPWLTLSTGPHRHWLAGTFLGQGLERAPRMRGVPRTLTHWRINRRRAASLPAYHNHEVRASPLTLQEHTHPCAVRPLPTWPLDHTPWRRTGPDDTPDLLTMRLGVQIPTPPMVISMKSTRGSVTLQPSVATYIWAIFTRTYQ